MKYLYLLFLVFFLLAGCGGDSGKLKKKPTPQKPSPKITKTEKTTQSPKKKKLDKKTKPKQTKRKPATSTINPNPFVAKTEVLVGKEREKYLPGLLGGGIKLLGIISDKNKKWAVIESASGQVFRVKQGSPVGNTAAFVKNVTNNSVKIVIPINNEPRSIILKLEEQPTTPTKAKGKERPK